MGQAHSVEPPAEAHAPAHCADSQQWGQAVAAEYERIRGNSANGALPVSSSGAPDADAAHDSRSKRKRQHDSPQPDYSLPPRAAGLLTAEAMPAAQQRRVSREVERPVGPAPSRSSEGSGNISGFEPVARALNAGVPLPLPVPPPLTATSSNEAARRARLANGELNEELSPTSLDSSGHAQHEIFRLEAALASLYESMDSDRVALQLRAALRTQSSEGEGREASDARSRSVSPRTTSHEAVGGTLAACGSHPGRHEAHAQGEACASGRAAGGGPAQPSRCAPSERSESTSSEEGESHASHGGTTTASASTSASTFPTPLHAASTTSAEASIDIPSLFDEPAAAYAARAVSAAMAPHPPLQQLPPMPPLLPLQPLLPAPMQPAPIAPTQMQQPAPVCTHAPLPSSTAASAHPAHAQMPIVNCMPAAAHPLGRMQPAYAQPPGYAGYYEPYPPHEPFGPNGRGGHEFNPYAPAHAYYTAPCPPAAPNGSSSTWKHAPEQVLDTYCPPPLVSQGSGGSRSGRKSKGDMLDDDGEETGSARELVRKSWLSHSARTRHCICARFTQCPHAPLHLCARFSLLGVHATVCGAGAQVMARLRGQDHPRLRGGDGLQMARHRRHAPRPLR